MVKIIINWMVNNICIYLILKVFSGLDSIKQNAYFEVILLVNYLLSFLSRLNIRVRGVT
jgi:hypothetical protein